MSVPRAGQQYTIEDLERLGDSFRGELIEGRLVPMSPTKWLHGVVCANLGYELGVWCRSRDTGYRLIHGECGFVVGRQPDIVLVPDLALVAKSRDPSGRDAFVEGAPDVAIEVLSEANTAREMERKLHSYFAAGARSVWIVDPVDAVAFVYRSPLERQRYAGEQSLADPNLPGFSVAVSSLSR